MRARHLQQVLSLFDRKGHWLFTRAHMRVMFPDEGASSLRESISRHIASGALTHVAHGLYANPVARSMGAYPLEALVPFLRPLELNYVSAESALSERGVISQMMENHLTVMTTGSSHQYDTPFGSLEFTRTRRNPDEIKRQIEFDPRRNLYVASLERAYSDLKRIGRNLDMVDHEELEDARCSGP